MKIDDGELTSVIADLQYAPNKVIDSARKVMKKGAVNIKKELVADAKKSKHFAKLARVTSFDETFTAGGAEYEIGPDVLKTVRGNSKRSVTKKYAPGTVGHIANIAYFGGANGGGGSLDFYRPAREEADNLQKHLGEVLKGYLR